MNAPQELRLDTWAEKLFGKEEVPHINTLRRWASEGRIDPQPTKIGKTWFVKPDAKYRAD